MLAAPLTMPAPLRWLDRLYALRDRLLASERFRRGAAAFPLTRPLARRNARALFDLCAGFVYSQVLLACVRVELFEILAEGPQPLARLAPRLALSEDAALRLLRAAVSLRLVVQRSGLRFALGPLGAPLVGNAAITAMIEHHAAFYADLEDPLALLRAERPGTALGSYWAYADTRPAQPVGADAVAAYSGLMSASQPLVADEILDAYCLTGHQCLMDVGGGEGRFVCRAAERAPALQFMLFDLPAVAERARERFAHAGISHRARATGGDFRSDPLPRGADVISLVRILHDHSDEVVAQLLRAAHDALPAGGTILIAEPLSGTRGAEPMGDAYFGFYLLAMGRGRPRTAAELGAMLVAAGFEPARSRPTHIPLQTSVLVARKGKSRVVNVA